ncbi:MAG: hypothetical protein SOH65_10200 [Bifidobacterium sp.]|jgi:hypothetical protein
MRRRPDLRGILLAVLLLVAAGILLAGIVLLALACMHAVEFALFVWALLAVWG